MFQGKYKKIIVGAILVILLAFFKLYLICTGDKPYLLHETVQYIGLNPSAGRVNYTSNDKLLSEVDDETDKQQPKELEQGIIKKQKEVEQSVMQETVEQSVEPEPVDQSVKREPVVKQVPVKQSVKQEPIEQSVKQEPVEKGVMQEIVEQSVKQVPVVKQEPVEQSVKQEPVLKVKQRDKTQLPGNINQGYNKQPPLPAVTGNPLQQLVDLIGTEGGRYHSYLKKLSTSQITSVINQLGMSNLTLQKSQIKFLSCGARRLLKQLKGKQLNSSLNMSFSFHHCKSMSFKSSGPSVALVSYPGSGNSWVRQLLEASTGIYTGAIYCDLAYVAVGMIGEFIDTRNVLAVKTHSLSSTSLGRQYDKAIYIIRNPFSTILAEHNRALAERAPKLYGDSHTAEINYKYGM